MIPKLLLLKLAGPRAGEGARRPLGAAALSPADIERIRATSAELQPGDVLDADANTGWLMHDALRVVRAVEDVDDIDVFFSLALSLCARERRLS